MQTIKTIELLFALYSCVLGYQFIWNGSFLASPVYEMWHEVGAVYWGAVLIFIAALHIAALIMNGRSRLISRTLRAIACASHLLLVVQFGVFFHHGGADWGAMTMALFAFLIVLILSPLMQETKHLWVEKNGKY